MESNGWDFQFGGADSDTMTSIEANESNCGSGSSGCVVHSDRIANNVLFTTEISDSQFSGGSSLEGGLQGLDLQDLASQQDTCPDLPFSSSHLLVATKFSQQKRFQRALANSSAHMLPTGHSYINDTLSLRSHGTCDGTKSSLPRNWEGVGRMTNESSSFGSNGSKTSSPQQVSPDSSFPAFGSSFHAGCFACGKDQTEHHNLIFQASPDFHDAMLDSFNCGSLQMKHAQDVIWPLHPQAPCGVLVPSFANHNSGNQSQNLGEAGTAKTKPRVRARRGQATDPHSIAERLRRERIADRIKSLQELVPHTNKTDRAIMLDEIIEYVKFLLVQVKLLSMSRLGSAGLILPIVSGISEVNSLQSPLDLEGDIAGTPQESISAIEDYVARLITNNTGAALQFLQRKGLCLAPISLMDTSKQSTDAVGNLTRPLNLLN